MAELRKINTRIVMRNDYLSAWQNSDKKLLKGEMAFARLSGDLDGNYLVRIGVDEEKTWNELSDQGQLIIPAANVEGLNEAIAALSTTYYETDDISKLSGTYVNGDIAVEKKDIAGDKQEYCAYRFDTKDGEWKALDGNYSAENVFFKDDITLAGDYTTVGNIKLTDGTLAASGKSVKTLMENIFTKEINAKIVTHPSWTFTSSSTLTGEVGTTYNPAAATATFSSRGSYNYQPSDTGVRVPVNNMIVKRTTTGFLAEISNDNELDQSNTVSLPAWSTALTYTSVDVSYNYEAYAYHTEGLSAKSNLGNTLNVKIAANDWSNSTAASACKKTATIKYHGYYPAYYAELNAANAFADPEAITSADIVSYTGSAVTAGAKFLKEVNTAQRPDAKKSARTYTCKQWIWVAKKGIIASTSKITTHLSSPDAAFGTVVKKASTVVLPTANGYGEIEYDVYYVNNGAEASNTYNWSIA